MIDKAFFEKIKTYCISTLSIQLFLFLLSLPIIVAWGLPISIMTLISTPLFGPALTIFLLMATLIFFCTICGLPYGMLLIMLDRFVQVWDYFLLLGSSQWLIAFIRPPLFLILFWSFFNSLFLLFVLQRPPAARVRPLLWYCIAIIILLCTQRYIPYRSTHRIQSKSGYLEIFFHNNKTTIIDQSFFTRQKSVESWVQYSLAPLLINHTGHTAVATLVVTKLSQNTVNAICAIMHYCAVQCVIIPKVINNQKKILFNSLVDKTANLSGIITSINEYALYIDDGLVLNIRYNREKKKLEVEEHYGTKKSSVHHRL